MHWWMHEQKHKPKALRPASLPAILQTEQDGSACIRKMVSGMLAQSFQSEKRHLAAVAKCHNSIAVYFQLVHRFPWMHLNISFLKKKYYFRASDWNLENDITFSFILKTFMYFWSCQISDLPSLKKIYILLIKAWKSMTDGLQKVFNEWTNGRIIPSISHTDAKALIPACL